MRPPFLLNFAVVRCFHGLPSLTSFYRERLGGSLVGGASRIYHQAVALQDALPNPVLPFLRDSFRVRRQLD